jgi:hypothetical protein
MNIAGMFRHPLKTLVIANVELVDRIVGELVQASRGTTPDPSSKEPSLKSPISLTQTITTTTEDVEDEAA